MLVVVYEFPYPSSKQDQYHRQEQYHRLKHKLDQVSKLDPELEQDQMWPLSNWFH